MDKDVRHSPSQKTKSWAFPLPVGTICVPVRRQSTRRKQKTKHQRGTVVEPVRGLIHDLETLSDGWAKGAAVMMLQQAGFACVMVCLALSPSEGPWAVEKSGQAWRGPRRNRFLA